MTTGSEIAPKRTRESYVKVRTGCSTCKARRIKCDEGRPICHRCMKGGRICEYKVAGPRRNVLTVYTSPTQSQPLAFTSDYNVNFFHQILASKLDGQFGSKFWSELVLQLSCCEPSVRHAVSAISIIYQDVESSLRDPAGYVNANGQAQLEWNEATKALATRISAQSVSHLVPLVCCLLFTCIEFLKGNVETSMLHVQSGFNILIEVRRKIAQGLSPGLPNNELKAIEDHIVPVFSRLHVLCSLAGRIIPPIYTPRLDEDEPQIDLVDSRQKLFENSDACIRFIHDTLPKANEFRIDLEDFVRQVKLQRRLDAWHDQLDDLLERMHADGKVANRDELNTLLTHYKVIYIWLRVCTTPAESALDAYQKEFEDLIQCAEAVVRPDSNSQTPPLLSFDLQHTGPLFYAALKCRDPKTRRRALEMLRLAPRREGLWNAHHAYVVAKRLIEIEERGLEEGQWPSEAARLHGLVLPDDQSRTYNLGRAFHDFHKLDHSIVPSPSCPGTLQAIFRRKPWGLAGDWEEFTEYIDL